jgi:hypothetical protein
LKPAEDKVNSQSPQENREDLAPNAPQSKPKEENVDEKGKVNEQKTEDSDKLRKNNDDQNQTLSNKLKTPEGIALLAALALTLALALKFIISAALAAQACTDCRDFKISVKSINPSAMNPIIGFFTKPSTVDVAYSAPTDYQPLEGKESFTFKDTGLTEMDGQTFTVDKVISNGLVQMKCGTSDCSDMKSTKGSINPNCADFNSRFNDQVDQAAAAVGDAAGSFLNGIMGNMGTILFVVLACVVLYFGISAFAKKE